MGDTENATLVTELLVGLRERGLDVTRPILCVLDGAKALRSAVLAVFDHPVLARCQLHKIRNVKGYLPDNVAKVVEQRMLAAYRNSDALAGQGDLEALAKELERQHPGAAGSLHEGLTETFTVARLGVPPTLARTLRSTNAVVIYRQLEGVHDVADVPPFGLSLGAGRGYLQPSNTQVRGRFGVRSAGGVARFAA
jgi:transposase-like protein